MIIKVQVAIGGELNTLIYDKNKSICIIEEYQFGMKLLGLKRPPKTVGDWSKTKGYFKAHLDKQRRLIIDKRIKNQNW